MVRRALLISVMLAVVVASGWAGVWLGRQRLQQPAPPAAISGTVSAEPTAVRAAISGRVRLVAVQAGDVVKAGQLVAWLEAPELRDAARQARDAVRDAQRDLDRLRAGRPNGAQEAYDRAKADADAAERALEDAQALSQDAPELAQRLEAATAKQEEAASALATAEAHLAEARSASGTPSGAGGALESGSGTSGDTQDEAGAPGGEDSVVSAATAAVDEARKRQGAADRELAEARRRSEEAQKAADRLSLLTQRAIRTASALEAARAELDSSSGADAQSEEDRLRGQVRDAQVAAALARNRLREAIVVAPAPGLVDRVAGTAGRELAAGEEIATIRRLDPVQVELTLTAAQMDRVHRKQKVVARTRSQPGVTFEGTVVETTPEDGEADSPWAVRVTLRNPAFRLRPGDVIDLTFR